MQPYLNFRKEIMFCGFELKINVGLGPHLFVKVPRPGDSKVPLCGLRVKLPPVTTSLTTAHSKVVAIPLSALPKDTTSELAAYLHTYPFKC